MKQEITKRKFEGEVVSDKGEKTIIVAVKTVKVHPLYQKRYVTTKRYAVHDEKNEYRVGDQVLFVETRPLSKSKRWRVISKAETKA